MTQLTYIRTDKRGKLSAVLHGSPEYHAALLFGDKLENRLLTILREHSIMKGQMIAIDSDKLDEFINIMTDGQR